MKEVKYAQQMLKQEIDAIVNHRAECENLDPLVVKSIAKQILRYADYLIVV